MLDPGSEVTFLSLRTRAVGRGIALVGFVVVSLTYWAELRRSFRAELGIAPIMGVVLIFLIWFGWRSFRGGRAVLMNDRMEITTLIRTITVNKSDIANVEIAEKYRGAIKVNQPCIVKHSGERVWLTDFSIPINGETQDGVGVGSQRWTLNMMWSEVVRWLARPEGAKQLG